MKKKLQSKASVAISFLCLIEKVEDLVLVEIGLHVVDRACGILLELVLDQVARLVGRQEDEAVGIVDRSQRGTLFQSARETGL